MSNKHKAAKNCRICASLSAKADCKERLFCQVGATFLQDKKVQELSAGARWLYLTMALEAKGRRDFVYPLSVAKRYGISSSSFRRQIRELVDAGFLTYRSMANLRRPNEYTFSLEWKEFRPPG